MVAHTFNPCAQKAGTGRSEFKASLAYVANSRPWRDTYQKTLCQISKQANQLCSCLQRKD